MRITLEVSGDCEATESPYWLILDPRQNMRASVDELASQITGPFFSRQEATEHLKARQHHFSQNAVVYCHSGYNSGQYHRAFKPMIPLSEEAE